MMHKKYKAKHYDEKVKSISSSKMIVSIILLALLALNEIGGILCYFISTAVVVNNFTIAETYTVHFDANEGIGTMPDQKIFCTAHTDLNLNLFTKDGCVFSGWNTSADGSGTGYVDGENIVDLALANSSITLYAQWSDETNEAEIDGVKYKTLSAAVSAVTANNVQKTIKLLRNVDITTTITISKNKNIVFDFQSFTLKNDANSNINIIANNGTLEIVRGTIQSSAANGAINNNATGNLIISGGNIITTGTRQAIYNAGGSVEITGDAYISTNSTERATVNNSKPTDGPAGTIKISCGTIVSQNTTTKVAVENSVTGTLIITGGEIISNKSMGVDNQGTLIIGENNVIVDITNPIIQGATYGVTSTNTATLEFYDGIIKGKENAFNNQNYVTAQEEDYDIVTHTEEISGDTYQTAYLETGKAKITFDANGGTTQEPLRLVDLDGTIGTLPTATREHHSFAGWFTEATGGEEISSDTIITGDTTYYAHWNTQYVTVTFDPNEGTISEQTKEVAAGESIGILPTPTRTDYGFAGWFTDPVTGTIINENEVITEDTTFYAHWISSYVAEIGSIKYETLQAAIDAIPNNNTETTINLLADTMEAVTVETNKNIVLNLQNFTLYNDGTKKAGDEYVAIQNKGTLKIERGTVTANSNAATINNESGARLIVTGGNIIQTGTGTSKNKQAIYNRGGTVEISGTAYISAKNSGSYQNNNRGAIQNFCSETSTGILIITGGTIESSTSYAIVNQSSAVLTLGTKDGTIGSTTPEIKGNTYGIQNNGIFNFYDGIVKGKNGSIEGTSEAVSDTEENATRVDTTEVIDTKTYNVTYYE